MILKPLVLYDWDAEIDFDPVPKGRPRFTSKGRPYTPKETRHAEDDIRHLLKLQKPSKLFSGPIEVRLVFYIKRPNSVRQKSRLFPHKKPDIDNYVKLMYDAANEIIWRDDAQICNSISYKRYADECDPRIFISVREMSPDEV